MTQCCPERSVGLCDCDKPSPSGRPVTPHLTRLEAEALTHAADYSLEWPAAIDIFGEAKDGWVKDKK